MSAEILLETASLIGVCTQLQTIHTDQSKRQSLRSSFLIMCFKFSQLFENEGCGIFITFTIMVLCIMLDLCTKTLTFVDVFKVFTFENIKLEYEFLSSTEKLLELQNLYFDDELVKKDINEIKIIDQSTKKLQINNLILGNE